MSTTEKTGNYISARDAASRVQLHPDYIARLARQSKIEAKQVGRKWQVEMASLEAFLAAKTIEKESWKQGLKEERRKEYKPEVAATDDAQTEEPETIVDQVEEKIHETVPARTREVIATGVRHVGILSTPGASAHAFGYMIHPGADFLHKVFALFMAFVVVFGVYGIFNKEFGDAAVQSVAYSASAAAAFGSVVVGAKPECDSMAQRLAASAIVSVTNLIISIDNAMPSNLPDSTLYALNTGCSQ